jgi:hypothetical protein
MSDLQSFLKKLRATAKVAKAAGLRQLDDAQSRKLFDIGDPGDMSGIGFYGHDLLGAERSPYCIRLDNPPTDKGKYRCPPGNEDRYLYCLLGADKLATAPVVLVESAKSVIAIASAGERSGRKVLPVAMNGCWGWKVKDVGATGDLDLLKDRDVILCLDSNVATKQQVASAEKELAAELLCRVRVRSLLCARLPLTINGPDDYLAKADNGFWSVLDSAVEPWRLGGTFASFENYTKAPEPAFLIAGVLQDMGVTFLGSLPGHGKTWILLSIIKALLSGEPLFRYFKVLQTVPRVIYLSPEVQLGQVRIRAERMGLGQYVKDGRLLIRTLTEGPRPDLLDPDIRMAARGAVVILDTAVRFMEGKENDSDSNRDGLGSKCFALLNAGAQTIIAAHHAPKATENANFLTLQNMLRGSGDLGAFLSGAWGLFQLDDQTNSIYVANLKPRDQDPFAPFVIHGRPYINDTKDFAVVTKPGDCPSFADIRKTSHGGKQVAPENADKIAYVTELVRDGEKSPVKVAASIKAKFGGTEPSRQTASKWIKKANLAMKMGD